MNQVILTGNLCRDIDLHKTVNDSYVGSSAIAVSRDRKNDKGEYESDFFDVKFFGKQADFAAKYLRKGNKVCVSGRIQIRDYVSRDGVKGRAIEVLVEKVESLSPKAEASQEADAPAQEVPAQDVTGGQNIDSLDLPDDDLPF